MRPRLYYSDQWEIPLPPGHKFPMRKYGMVRELLAPEGLYDFVPEPPADPAIIELAHDPAYVRAFLGGTLDRAILRRIGFPWSEGLVNRTLASVGGTLAAARDALARGFGANLAGGTHHAFRSEGSGFCVFNDIAIAIEWLRSGREIERAAVLDLDVHQGDGTARMFENDPGVLTVSMHGRNNFPFRKQRSRIDIDLADGTGDVEYLAVLDSVLPRIFEWRPEVLFFQSGVDTLAVDRLGRLALSEDGLAGRDRRVFGACRAHGTPAVVTLGGGYADPIERTAAAHANTFRIAAELFR